MKLETISQISDDPLISSRQWRADTHPTLWHEPGSSKLHHVLRNDIYKQQNPSRPAIAIMFIVTTLRMKSPVLSVASTLSALPPLDVNQAYSVFPQAPPARRFYRDA